MQILKNSSYVPLIPVHAIGVFFKENDKFLSSRTDMSPANKKQKLKGTSASLVVIAFLLHILENNVVKFLIRTINCIENCYQIKNRHSACDSCQNFRLNYILKQIEASIAAAAVEKK